MSISFNKALGNHPQALALRERRNEVLASNLANADTPGYKARDLDFQSILKKEMPINPLDRTNKAHLEPSNTVLGAKLLYRNPFQASIDGNTVEEHIEQGKFAQNGVQYQASLMFVKGGFKGLITAIRGN